MINSILEFLDQYTFFGISNVVWFIFLPVSIFILINKYNKFMSDDSEKLEDRLPNTPVYINLSSEELDMLNDIKRKYKNDDKIEKFTKKFIREEIKNYGSY